ncbi:laccase [Serpula lacrymans var. lacrymans S7.3]|uniref:Laccase n=2 Tax=Serpula lacrymans var. lacrymans TaxID=341189 RepID=F8Q492_SERL3|nr:laccase [Serpula lacrymans var. lacrymans S7.9]EGN96947.1 laccase [Serpula lacrymans var. lacrymans S7.3]EGO22539.1 laccase [Serpula lacrymans var. lacrymans S7.9]
MFYHIAFILLLSTLPSPSFAASIVRGPYPRSSNQGPSTVVGPVTDLNIVNKVIAPDGFERSATLAGGTFPGPIIKANIGDHFSVNVHNQLVDNSMPKVTSIHWHGIFQHGTSYADGTSSVTQCPITANHSFQYNFDVPDQSGTYWYHSHFSTQYCDGLRGPLVIYDPNDPLAYMYDVDDETTIITLADWYHDPSSELNQINGAVTANSTLINGLGRYPGGPASALAVVNVQQGKRYRFRLISMSCDPNFIFSIDGHNMTVIEADGIETEPVEVDSIQIFSAQRYSVVFTANQPVDNYWIRAESNLPNQTFAGGLNSAILRYNGAPALDPTTESTIQNLLVESDLHPLINPGAPGIPEIGKADININFDIDLLPSGLFTMNSASFVTPAAPVLLQILSGSQHPMNLLPAGSVYTLEPNKTVEISVPYSASALGGPHPMHLHGHTFDVIRTSGNSTPNFVNPVRRDTVSLGGNPGDNVTFRFVTDNFGPWFFHCHIDWHLNKGFAVVMAEAPKEIKNHSSSVPAAWDELCPLYDGLTGAQQ